MKIKKACLVSSVILVSGLLSSCAIVNSAKRAIHYAGLTNEEKVKYNFKKNGEQENDRYLVKYNSQNSKVSYDLLFEYNESLDNFTIDFTLINDGAKQNLNGSYTWEDFETSTFIYKYENPREDVSKSSDVLCTVTNFEVRGYSYPESFLYKVERCVNFSEPFIYSDIKNMFKTAFGYANHILGDTVVFN